MGRLRARARAPGLQLCNSQQSKTKKPPPQPKETGAPPGSALPGAGLQLCSTTRRLLGALTYRQREGSFPTSALYSATASSTHPSSCRVNTSCCNNSEVNLGFAPVLQSFWIYATFYISRTLHGATGQEAARAAKAALRFQPQF